jgi:hypothetical protein
MLLSRGLQFAVNVARIFIVAKAGKERMPQMMARGPFGEFDLRNKFRFKPSTLFHDVCGQGFSPPRGPGFGQIRKWTHIGFESFESLPDFPAKRWNKAVLDLRHNFLAGLIRFWGSRVC